MATEKTDTAPVSVEEMAALADIAARDEAIKKLRWQVEAERTTEDNDIIGRVLLDMAAMLRTGVMTEELKYARVTLGQRWGNRSLSLKVGKETVLVSFERDITRPPALDEATARYEAGQRPE